MDPRRIPPAEPDSKESSKDEALRRVKEALNRVKYGEIIVKIQAGKPIHVESVNRERVG